MLTFFACETPLNRPTYSRSLQAANFNAPLCLRSSILFLLQKAFLGKRSIPILVIIESDLCNLCLDFVSCRFAVLLLTCIIGIPLTPNVCYI